jgi:hypothetical protein
MIERKNSGSGNFIEIGKLKLQSSGNYVFTDKMPFNGENIYRLKIVSNTAISYTNSVRLQGENSKLVIYPNPVKNQLNISFAETNNTNYKLQLFNDAGHIVYQEQLKNVSIRSYSFNRTSTIKPGIYLLKLVSTTGNVIIKKIVFE